MRHFISHSEETLTNVMYSNAGIVMKLVSHSIQLWFFAILLPILLVICQVPLPICLKILIPRLPLNYPLQYIVLMLHVSLLDNLIVFLCDNLHIVDVVCHLV